MNVAETLSSVLDAPGVTVRDTRRMVQALRVRVDQIDFVLNHHKNKDGQPMDFADYPYFPPIYEDTCPVMAIMSCVQVGKTEYLMTYAMACLKNGLNVFHVLPKFDSRNTFVADRVNLVLDSVPVYRDLQKQGTRMGASQQAQNTARRPLDNLSIKHFGRGTWKFVGSNVAADYKEFPADVLVADELDWFDLSLFDMAHERYDRSAFKFQRYVSNPTVEEHGIHEYFLKGTQFEWHLDCGDCGDTVMQDFFSTVAEEVTDAKGNVLDYRQREATKDHDEYTCPRCDGILDRDSGRWIALNPGAPFSSYHISKMMYRGSSPQELYAEFMAVRQNDTKLQIWYNSKLGLPYSASGSRLSEELLIAASVLDGMPKKLTKGWTSMGVDVGTDLDVRISQRLKDGTRCAVYIGKVPDFADLHGLIKRYRVKICVVDAMPETRAVHDFQKAAKIPVFACVFSKGEKGAVKGVTPNYNDKTVGVDRTFALDGSLEEFKLGRNLLPKTSRALCKGQFYKEMTNDVRIWKIRPDGEIVPYWTKKDPDHQRLADTYDWIAGQVQAAPAAEAPVNDTEAALAQKASEAMRRISRRRLMVDVEVTAPLETPADTTVEIEHQGSVLKRRTDSVGGKGKRKAKRGDFFRD